MYYDVLSYCSNELTPGYVCGVMVHPLSSTIPSSGISRVICSSSNITSWSGPTVAAASVYLASIAYSKSNSIIILEDQSEKGIQSCYLVLVMY